MDEVHCMLSMSDTGEGIDPDVLASGRVTEPFYTTRGGGSRGLGLAIVEGCLLAFGGTLAIDSVVGRGTTVRTYWPVATPEQEER